jgi:methionyl-tRNA formyltransferase
MRFAYFGSPDYSKNFLEKIFTSKYELAFIVSNPPKEKGRGRELIPTPVTEFAIQNNIPYFTPLSLKEESILEEFKKFDVDFYFIFSYGKIIPKMIFELPKFKSLNLHGSVLPKYRGASPVQTAILNGDEDSGYSFQVIAEKMDAGDILFQEKIKIESDDNTETYLNKIINQASIQFEPILDQYTKGYLIPQPQNHQEASFCSKLNPKDLKLNLSQSPIQIRNAIRAYRPYLNPYFLWGEKRVQILEARPFLENMGEKILPGSIRILDKSKLVLELESGAFLEIERLQLEGKKPMVAKDFINGYKNSGTIVWT